MEINEAIVDELMRIAPGQVFRNEPMARHTSFGLGGPADLYLRPSSPSAMRETTALLADSALPTMILGFGTNLLVRDAGLDGAVVSTDAAFSGLSVTPNGVHVGSGVSLSKLLIFDAEKGLSGLEALAGIPGSVGGAVVTNAGSFGTSFGERIASIGLFDPKTGAQELERGAFSVEYRRLAIPPGSIVEDVLLELESGDREDILARQREFVERKWKTQPAGMRSAGCVFKNPPGDYAGRLIESSGLKGKRMRGAVVSDIHANYILNDRGATAADVEELVALVRERVLAQTGQSLELEIEIVGRRA
jgi:UDP-N-acetylmuramate dehydrogenase